MTTTEWITDIALLLVVFRQIRQSRLSRAQVAIPLAIIAWVANHYLHSIPTAGNDLVLILTLVTVGAVLGIAGGIYTRIRYQDGDVLVQAGAVAATLWVIGMSARMGFQLWSENGGGATIERFSVAHQITSIQAWVSALVLMAVTEVVTRVATIILRGHLARRAAVLERPTAPALRVQA